MPEDRVLQTMVHPTFTDLGLGPDVLAALKAKGFEEPTPIQALVIPALLSDERDIIGQAQTGTGKTAAFGLPLVDKLKPLGGYVQALILTPTRELALQVSEEIGSFRISQDLQIACFYGGQSMSEQLRRLKKGVDLAVGTPGRVMDLMDRGKLDLSKIDYLIMDEADEMLNMGFLEDMEKIMSQVNPERRILLFSATMPTAIREVAGKFMKNPQTLSVKSKDMTTQLTDQIYFEVAERDKFEALCRIVDVEEAFYGIVFCRTKIQVDETWHKLTDRGYDADALHGDLSQGQREMVLKKFKAGTVNLLICTDVAARGLDISKLTHVINYSLPSDPESYVHRIGRTGRAGKNGTAITFITPIEFRKFKFIQRTAGAEARKKKVPGVGEVLEAKRKRLETKLQDRLTTGADELFTTWAQNLATERDPIAAMAAVLQEAFGKELDAKEYGSVQDLDSQRSSFGGREGGRDYNSSRSSNGSREYAPRDGGSRDHAPRSFGAPREGHDFSEDAEAGGNARLYVAYGRADGYTARRVVDLIKKIAGTRDHKIDDVEVGDRGTFLTVSLKEAEFILRAFKRHEHQGKPLVSMKKAAPGASTAPTPPRRFAR